ncbi:MAG: TlpA family protein disulfide reductase [Crocinitomicaceae bacterium]|nr:TlpA family protein disulfide reductase [Crocinitomicaceae bacterium]
MKSIFLFLFFSLAAAFVIPEKTYAQELKFEFKDLPDTTIYLVRYYGPYKYYADTSISKNGVVKFEASKHQRGVYAVWLPGNSYYEFILDNERVHLQIDDARNMINSTTVLQSENNKIFFVYVRKMIEYNDHLKKLNDQYAASSGNENQLSKIKKEIQDETIIWNKYKRNLAESSEPLFVSQLIWLTVDVEYPDSLKDADGNFSDQKTIHQYYVDHYWDGVNLKEPGLIQTPVFSSKLDAYFSQNGILQQADTVIKYSVLLLNEMDQIDSSNYVFSYTLDFLMNKYDQMQIVGMDKVFWHLGRNYYCPPNNKAWWITPENLDKICKRVSELQNSLIGLTAANLILTDSTEKKWISLYDIKTEYTVLYFWDPNCGHCKTQTPKLQQLYEQKLKKRGVEVYAVAYATGDAFADWKKFIADNKLTFINVGLTKSIYEQMMKDVTPLLQYTTMESLYYSDVYDVFSTPKVFVLDKDKKILIKQISVETLEVYMDELTGHKGDPIILSPEEQH